MRNEDLLKFVRDFYIISIKLVSSMFFHLDRGWNLIHSVLIDKG